MYIFCTSIYISVEIIDLLTGVQRGITREYFTQKYIRMYECMINICENSFDNVY